MKTLAKKTVAKRYLSFLAMAMAIALAAPDAALAQAGGGGGANGGRDGGDRHSTDTAKDPNKKPDAFAHGDLDRYPLYLDAYRIWQANQGDAAPAGFGDTGWSVGAPRGEDLRVGLSYPSDSPSPEPADRGAGPPSFEVFLGYKGILEGLTVVLPFEDDIEDDISVVLPLEDEIVAARERLAIAAAAKKEKFEKFDSTPEGRALRAAWDEESQRQLSTRDSEPEYGLGPAGLAYMNGRRGYASAEIDELDEATAAVDAAVAEQAARLAAEGVTTVTPSPVQVEDQRYLITTGAGSFRGEWTFYVPVVEPLPEDVPEIEPLPDDFVPEIEPLPNESVPEIEPLTDDFVPEIEPLPDDYVPEILPLPE